MDSIYILNYVCNDHVYRDTDHEDSQTQEVAASATVGTSDAVRGLTITLYFIMIH